MKFLAACIAILAYLSASWAAPSFYNVLDPDTGDFGGFAFNLRSEFSTFTEVDVNGDLSAYGFYMPTLSRQGIESPNPFDPPLGAALRFDTSSLGNPDQLPYHFILLNFNPGGHPPMQWLHPHFDIHLFLETPEFSRAIECFNSTFPPCFTNTYLDQLFSTLPNSDFFPAGYFTLPDFYVPTMGTHLTGPITNDFMTNPAPLFGSYNGELIFHEPMIASSIFNDTEMSGPLTFSWPSTNRFPKSGRFFTQFTVETQTGMGAGDRYKVTFHSLVDAPESTGSTSVFMGMPFVPSAGSYSNNPSSKKDCLINSVDIDGGFLVVSGSTQYCCRAQGTMNGAACERPTCSGTAPLVNPPTAFFHKIGSNKCYAKCYERT